MRIHPSKWRWTWGKILKAFLFWKRVAISTRRIRFVKIKSSSLDRTFQCCKLDFNSCFFISVTHQTQKARRSGVNKWISCLAPRGPPRVDWIHRFNSKKTPNGVIWFTFLSLFEVYGQTWFGSFPQRKYCMRDGKRGILDFRGPLWWIGFHRRRDLVKTELPLMVPELQTKVYWCQIVSSTNEPDLSPIRWTQKLELNSNFKYYKLKFSSSFQV